MRKFFLAAAVAVAALLSNVSSADAAFRLRVESGLTTGPGVVLTDGAAGDGSPGANSISFMGSIGQFTLILTVGTQTPLLQIPGFFEGMDLTNVTINTGGAGTLRLILESDDFGANTPNGGVALSNQIGGVLSAGAGSSLTTTSYASDGSFMPAFGADVIVPGAIAALPGAGVGSIGHLATSVGQTFGPGAFSGTVLTNFAKTGGYSLYNVITVNFTGAGSVSFNSVTATNPAPAGLVLALAGMPFFAIGARIRRRKAVTA